MGLGAAQLWRSRVPASAPSAGTGREGRKRRKSRNGCMVSTGFPVPPQEPELHQVQTAPAPGGRQHQPHGGDLTAHSGWRGCAPRGTGGERGPLCGAGGGLSPGVLRGRGLRQGTSCPAQRRAPAPSCSCCALAVGQGTLRPRLGPVWLPTATLESRVLGHVQAWHLPLGLSALFPSCHFPTRVLVPGSSLVPVCPAAPAVGTGVTIGQNGAGAAGSHGAGGPGRAGTMAALPSGSRPAHTAEVTLLFLTPHFLLSSTVPTGSSCHGAWDACFECALQGRWRGAGRTLPPTAGRPGHRVPETG